MNRPRSPIEAMVDQACGITPAGLELERERAAKLDAQRTQALLAIEKNACAWWRMMRPVNWTEEQHLKNPTVNCSTTEDQKLSRSVAKWIKLGG